MLHTRWFCFVSPAHLRLVSFSVIHKHPFAWGCFWYNESSSNGASAPLCTASVNAVRPRLAVSMTV